MPPLSEQFASKIATEGGASVNIQTGQPPASGAMVSRFGHEKQVPGTAKAPDVESFMGEHHEHLDKPDVYMGGWADAGKTYLDESLNFGDRRQAIAFGKANAQRAYYDVDADKARRIRYEGRQSPEGTLFEGFRRAHAQYARGVSEAHRREVEFDLLRAGAHADAKNTPKAIDDRNKAAQGTLF